MIGSGGLPAYNVEMGIRFYCPNGHKLNVKAFLAGKRGICPHCGAKVQIPADSTLGSGDESVAEEDSAEASSSSSRVAEVPVHDDAASTIEVEQAGPSGEDESASLGDQPLVGDDSLASMDLSDDTSVGTDPAALGPSTPPALPQATQLLDDPLDEAPDAVWYVRLPDGEQFGPAAVGVMRQWLEEGRIGGDCLVWREGWRDWRQAVDAFPRLRDGLMPEIDSVGQSPTGGVVGGGGHAGSSRGKSNTTRAFVITVLLLAVIVGSVALVWVLSR